MTNNKINRKVHEALGLKPCEHEWIDKGWIPFGDYIKYQCKNCGIQRSGNTNHPLPTMGDIPAYTDDPRLGEPLEKELLGAGWKIDYDFDTKEYCFDLGDWVTPVVMNKVFGVARCLAWLKMKGVEIE
jgi:hypothetical protein